jgi:hypothetical protein
VLRAENRRLREEVDAVTRDYVDARSQGASVAWLRDKVAEYESTVRRPPGPGPPARPPARLPHTHTHQGGQGLCILLSTHRQLAFLVPMRRQALLCLWSRAILLGSSLSRIAGG